MGELVDFNSVLEQTANMNSMDPIAGGNPIPAPRRARACACKKPKRKGKGGPLLMAGSAFLVGYGLAMLASR